MFCPLRCLSLCLSAEWPLKLFFNFFLEEALQLRLKTRVGQLKISDIGSGRDGMMGVRDGGAAVLGRGWSFQEHHYHLFTQKL